MAAIACGLAALCYAEFASTVPVAGSAYTFSYATFGELVAWTIGWDLVLEFAVGSAVVAKGWSQYLAEVMSLTGVTLETATVEIGFLTLDWGALFIPPAAPASSDKSGLEQSLLGIIGSLVIVTVRYVAVSLVLTGMVYRPWPCSPAGG